MVGPAFPSIPVSNAWVIGFLAFFLGLGPSFGESPEIQSPRPSIPLPGGTLHMAQGLVGTFAGGKVRDFKDDQGLFQWQGEVAYAYKPYLTAGAGFRLRAGEPYKDQQKVENRYFISMRFHKRWSVLDLYTGPQLGLDNLNLTASLTDSAGIDLSFKPFTKTFTNTGAGLGFEFGLGYKPFPWGGLTFGHRVEYSLANLAGTRRELRSFNFRTLPGLSFDLLHFFPKLGQSVQAFYAYGEYQTGYLVFPDQKSRLESAWVLGMTLGF
jgi:hypothetical protein